MAVKTPPGMPPWWNRRIECRHCGVYIKAFTPKHEPAWERELQKLTEIASERCYCRRPAAELRELLQQPEDRHKEHSLYRTWLSWALQYRYQECGEGRIQTGEWHQPMHVPGLVIKPPPKEPKKRAAARSGKKR